MADGKGRLAVGDAASRVFTREPADRSGGISGTNREPTRAEQGAAWRLAHALREA